MNPRLLLACALSATAWATPEFPSRLSTELSVDAPACTVCHSQPSGGAGTATTAFARSMVSAGLRAYDSDSLGQALSRLSAEAVDSDDDGLPDVDELRAGDNPSVPRAPNGDPAQALAPQPVYGCQTTGSSPMLMLSLALLFCAHKGRGCLGAQRNVLSKGQVSDV